MMIEQSQETTPFKFMVRIAAMGPYPEIEISEAEFSSLRDARKIVSEVFYVEELYDLLITTFVEFEEAISRANIDYMIYGMVDYEDFYNHRRTLNLRLNNLLSVSRLYLDQAGKHLKKLMEGSPEFLSKICSYEYDNNPDYRFMCALRNFVQHRGLPLHWITYGGGWKMGQDGKKDGYLEFSVELEADKKNFEEDDKFKKQVLDEMPNRVDLAVSTSGFIGGLSSIHQKMRDEVAPSVDEARRKLEQVHSRYQELLADEKSTIGLSVIKKNERGEWAEEVSLTLRWDDIRLSLRKKNHKLVNLSKRIGVSRASKGN